MKFISWNVNGLRAIVGKGFADAFTQLDADFFCLQETKKDNSTSTSKDTTLTGTMPIRKVTLVLLSTPSTNLSL